MLCQSLNAEFASKGVHVVHIVIDGAVEQWLHQEKRILHPGDSVFIPADVVHASFNTGNAPAKLMAILGPCVGEGGYISVEMGEQEPWKSMR